MEYSNPRTVNYGRALHDVGGNPVEIHDFSTVVRSGVFFRVSDRCIGRQPEPTAKRRRQTNRCFSLLLALLMHQNLIKERTKPADALHLGTVRPFYFLASLFGLRVRLLGHGRRVPPYEVVDREKNDRTDERTWLGALVRDRLHLRW